MPDVKKKVLTKYELDAKQANAAASKLQKRMGMLARASDKVTGRIGRLGRMLAAPAGLSLAGVGGLVKHLVDVGREGQDARLALAEMLQAVSRSTNMPLQGFERATAVAAKLREQFFLLARDSPLSAKGIQDAFMKMTFSLSAAGLSLQQQISLARDVAVADMSSLVKGTAAADVKQILTGTATVRQITTQALQGVKAEALKLAKKGKVQEAAALIAKAVTLDPKALEARGRSATGVIESFSDRLFQIKQKIAGPLMEFLVEKMEEWGAWLDANKEKVAETAKAIGEGIVRALKQVIKAVKWLADNWKTILSVVKVLATVWIAGKLVSGISTLISMASKFSTILRNARPGGGRGRGLGGFLARGAGAVGLAVTAAELGEDVGEGLAGLFVGEKGRRTVERARAIEERIGPKMTTAEYKAYIASLSARKKASPKEKLEEDALAAQIDPVKQKRRGKKKQKVDRMEVKSMGITGTDARRLSTRFAVGVRRESRAMRQIVGMGLGAGAIGVGVG